METGQGGAEAQEMREEPAAQSFAEFLMKPESLPPHRTVSPGYSGDEVILDEVALIAEKGEEDVALAGDSGNHSSEEELEEINTNKSHYVERDCKRKWTDTSCDSDTEFEEPELGLEVREGEGGKLAGYLMFDIPSCVFTESRPAPVVRREAAVPQPGASPARLPSLETTLRTRTTTSPPQSSSLLPPRLMSTSPGGRCRLLPSCLG